MELIITSLQGLFANFAPFFILLGLLIFVHELGHFLVAKFFGVRVETFSLGFGKKILKIRRGDTDYCISAIPLGGYVKMFGDDPTADVPEDQKKFSFLHKPVSQRVAVVLAGPLMNLFFAVVVFMTIAIVGEELPAPVVGDVAPNSKAYEAGFRSGDKILAINTEATPTWVQVREKIESAPGEMLDFTLERSGEAAPINLAASPTVGENENILSSNRSVGVIDGLSLESRSTLVGIISPDSPAGQAGFQSLDLIDSVAGTKVTHWRDLNPLLARVADGKPEFIEFIVRNINTPESEAGALRSLKVPVQDLVNAPPEDWVKAIGMEPAELYIYQIKKGSPADTAGLKVSDRVLKINGKEMMAWEDVLNQVKGFDPSHEGLDFVIRRNGEELAFKIKPEMTKLMTLKGQEEQRFTIGIVSGFYSAPVDTVSYRVSGLGPIVKKGLADTYSWTEFVVMSFVRLIQGEVSAKNVGGVITIGRVASHSFAAGLSSFLKTMAIISINLFLINLMPIPILDGGHLLFYTIEGLQGAPLSMRKMELAQQIGLMLLMILMAFAFYNDISNLIKAW
ncbi:MAG: RIP metalloprotease RseP [Bdellovibrionales bacterium]